jgi:uncharacterized protein (DUF362 family)
MKQNGIATPHRPFYHRPMPHHACTRRRLLEGACALGSGVLLGGCSAGPLRAAPDPAFLKLPPAPQPGRVVLGMYSSPDMRGLCDSVLPAISDLRWLSRGESVFLKIACNSPNLHPSVTDPEAVAEVVRFLKARGAGRIYVGDQAGVEHVRLTREGRVSSTREMLARNGLRDALTRAGARVHCFDDEGWDGYFRAEPDFPSVWQRDLWLPKILQRVDHVVYVPRLGSHSLAGYTCGVKNAVGWLRDDSRLVLHQKGAAFYERIAEINHFEPLRSKLRLTITLCHAVLTNIGPDFGDVYPLPGCLALASTRLVDHDAVAAALLPWFDEQQSSLYDLYAPFPEHVNYWNRGLVEQTWGKDALQAYEPIAAYPIGGPIGRDACLSYLGRLQGYGPSRIEVQRAGDAWPAGLFERLQSLTS